MDEQHWRRTSYMNSIAGRASGQGSFGLKTYTRRIINTQQLLSYDQDFGKHHVDALVGHEYEDLDRKDVNFGTSYELLPGYIIPGNFVGHYTNYGGENTAPRAGVSIPTAPSLTWVAPTTTTPSATMHQPLCAAMLLPSLPRTTAGVPSGLWAPAGASLRSPS